MKTIKDLELAGKRVVVEYTDPNPFKVMHIGHLFSNTVGESISRLLEFSGAIVKRANYQGDVGLHVAKVLWGLKSLMEKEGFSLSDMEKMPLEERVSILGRAYALGATAYKEDERAKEEIKKINVMVYSKDRGIWETYEKGRKWSLDYFERIYKRLGTRFDFYFFESDTGEIGKKIVEANIGKVFEESEGAIVFPGEKYGLHTRVFINSLGLPTYEAKDLGLAHLKWETWQYDRSIIITANEVDEYFKVILKALELVNPELGKRTMHLSHGFVRLPEGKMSSRTGNVITAEWLLDETKKKIMEMVRSMGRGISEEDADRIGVAAIKYALLRSAIGKDVVFSFDRSLSFEGNSGPYLLYTYARARSILENAEGLDMVEEEITENDRPLLRWLARFQETAERAVRELSPHILANYAFELCQRFNSLYTRERFISDGKAVAHRIGIARKTAKALKLATWILGFEVLERM